MSLHVDVACTRLLEDGADTHGNVYSDVETGPKKLRLVIFRHQHIVIAILNKIGNVRIK